MGMELNFQSRINNKKHRLAGRELDGKVPGAWICTISLKEKGQGEFTSACAEVSPGDVAYLDVKHCKSGFVPTASDGTPIEIKFKKDLGDICVIHAGGQ